MTAMTTLQLWATILIIMAGTVLTRAAAFLIFRPGKPVPGFVRYLGKVLPAAVIGLLLVYCLRGTDILSGSHGLPEAIALLILFLVHQWRRNTLLSIAAGTVVYMLCVQLLF